MLEQLQFGMHIVRKWQCISMYFAEGMNIQSSALCHLPIVSGNSLDHTKEAQSKEFTKIKLMTNFFLPERLTLTECNINKFPSLYAFYS